MCGIAGVHVKSRYKGSLPLNNILDYLLVHIAERGKHATGFVSVDFGGKGVVLKKEDIPADKFVQTRKPLDTKNIQTILGHTRYATQGAASDFQNNHPVLYGSCFVTHNGHINNDDEVLDEYDLKEQRPAAVDSIAISIALDRCGLDSITNIQEGLGKLAGNMACAVIDPVKHPGRLVLAKGSSSPLIVLHHKTGFYWASTKAAIDFMWGSLIGTPPTKIAKDPTQLGWYDFKYGEAWLIDGDEAAPFKFNPAHYVRRGRGWNSDSWNSRGSSSHGAGFRSSDTGNLAGLVSYTKYTCKPNSTACETPCEGGCQSITACTCKDTVWKYQGTEYGFNPTELIRSRTNHGCSVPPASTCRTPRHCASEGECDCKDWGIGSKGVGNSDTTKDSDGDGASSDPPTRILGQSVGTGPQGKVRCESCWDWYNIGNLIEITLGSQDFTLCGECAIEEGWGAKAIADATYKEDEGDDEVLDHYQTVAEAANAAHQLAVEATANNLKCKPEFVNWVLFQATLEDLSEGGKTLASMRRVVEDEYEANYDEAIA